MLQAFQPLSVAELQSLAADFRSGRLTVPPSAVSLQRILQPTQAESVAAAIAASTAPAWHPEHLAALLEAIAGERAATAAARSALDLVWTGPEAAGMACRDTGVVVSELFSTAHREVLVAGYAVYQGKKVFKALADRMERVPELKVRLFLDVHRGQKDTTAPEVLVLRFAREFRDKQWPGARLPEVYFDPRAVELNDGPRASLHAKCVVIDDQTAFVSSANFTEAAQQRNIELGLLIKDAGLASAIAGRFRRLAELGVLLRVPFGS